MFEMFCTISGYMWISGAIILVLLLIYTKQRDLYPYLFVAFWPVVAFAMLCLFIFADLGEVEDDEGNSI